MDRNPTFFLADHDTPPPLRVLVSHPEPLLAMGLVAALRQQAGVEASMAGIHPGPSAEAWPDVVVTDYRGGLALAREAARRGQRRSAVMIMTMYDREHDIKAAMEAGVHGYLLQGCSIEELATGVSLLAGGGRYFCLEVAQRIADSLTREPLTPRETDVLRLLALGQCNKSIARQLEITVGTVKGHLRAIFDKLQAGSRTEAVGIAARRGLIGEPMPTGGPSSSRVARSVGPAPRAPHAARGSDPVRIRASLGRPGLELARDRFDQLVRGREHDLPAGHQVLDATRQGGGCGVGAQLQHIGAAVRVFGFGVEDHG